MLTVKEALRQYGMLAGVVERTDKEETKVYALYQFLVNSGEDVCEPEKRTTKLPPWWHEEKD